MAGNKTFDSINITIHSKTINNKIKTKIKTTTIMKEITIQLTDKEAQIVGLISSVFLANCFEKEIKSTVVKNKN